MPDKLTPESSVDDWSEPLATTAGEASLGVSHTDTAHTSGGSSGDFAMLWSRLWDQKWLALIVASLLAAPGVTAVLMLHEPLFLSRATIEVSPTHEPITTDRIQSVPRYQQYLNDQAALINSERILQRVLEQPTVRETKWFTQEAKAVGSRMLALHEAMGAAPRRQTSLVDIEMTARSNKEAALIANAIMDEYLRDVYTRASETDNVMLERIDEELQTLRSRIDDLRTGITSLRSDAGHWTPQELLAQQRMRLDEKHAEHDALENQIKIAAYQLGQMEAAAAERGDQATTPQDPEERPPYEADPTWRDLNLACEAARDAIELETHLGEDHPRMAQLRMIERQALEKRQAHEQQLDVAWSIHPPTQLDPATPLRLGSRDLGKRIEFMREQLELLEEEIRDETERVKRTANLAGQLQERLNELSHYEERYQELRDRKVTMVMEARAPASIREFDRATPQPTPVNSRTRLMLLAACVLLGSGVGVGVAFLRARGSHAIGSLGEVPLTQAPFLGHIPFVRNPQLLDLAMQAEHIRMLRTTLLQRLGPGRGKRIQITSAGPGAGKSTAAIMLAESLGRCGKKVLLIDGDLRHPTLHERCQIPGTPGLIDVLRSSVTDAEAIRPSPATGISILPAGMMQSGADAELLANGVLPRAIRRWAEQFDILLFDSAPLLPVADSRILAGHMDGTLMLVREKHCHRTEIGTALRELNASGANLLGMIFVGRKHVTARYHGGYYNDYHGHYYPSDTPALTLDAHEAKS